MRNYADIDYRNKLLSELVRLAEEDGLEPNYAKLRQATLKYSTEDIERVVDAFERFGAKNVFKSM